MIVDGLVQLVPSGDHERSLAEGKRGHDRPDSSVTHDGRSAPHELDELLVRHELEPGDVRYVGLGRRVTVLDDYLLDAGERHYDVERTLKERFLGAKAEEDQKIAPSYSALR